MGVLLAVCAIYVTVLVRLRLHPPGTKNTTTITSPACGLGEANGE